MSKDPLKCEINYLASPYSHPEAKWREYRYHRAKQAVAWFAKEGTITYSPIVHWHNVAEEYDLPTDAKFWETFNHSLLVRCNKLFVLELDGWDKSKGVKAEMALAKQCGIDIEMVEAGEGALTWER